MMNVLLLFSCISTGYVYMSAVVGAPVQVTGHRGETVHITCPYESGYETNKKYLCKGECFVGFRNIIVESGSPPKDDRFSLIDDTTARVFTVTITDLRADDEGKYWCGVSTPYLLLDEYSEILLLVKSDTLGIFPVVTLVCVSVGLTLMLIGLLVALTVLRGKKSPRIAHSGPSDQVSAVNFIPESTPEDFNYYDHVYQEIAELQPYSTVQGPVDSTIYSSAETPADSTIYSTAEIPVDSTIYSSAETPANSTIYSTAEIPVDSTIYSTAETPVDSTIYSTTETPVDSTIYSTAETPVDSTIYSTTETPVDSTIYSTAETPVDSTIYSTTETPLQRMRACSYKSSDGIVVDGSQCVDITVTGNKGADVHIKCPYSQGYEGCGKYFYKGAYKDRVTILSSGEKSVNGRFSMQDDKKTRTFTVTIRNLTMTDAGSYSCEAWCKISRDFKNVLLKVNKAPVISKPVDRTTSTPRKQTPSPSPSIDTTTDCTSTGHDTSSRANTAGPLSQMYSAPFFAVAVGLVLVLLVLCFGSFLLLKLWRKKCGTALYQQNDQQNRENACMYKEIPNCDFESCDVTTLQRMRACSYKSSDGIVVDGSLCVDIAVTGNKGADVHIKCPYSQGYEGCDKYFYKGAYKDRVTILSSGEKTINGRFSMQDNKKTRTFTVTIRNLTMTDAGSYSCEAWCKISRDFKNVLLKVNKATVISKPADRTTSTPRKQTPSPSPSIDTTTDCTSTVSHQTGSERTSRGNPAGLLSQDSDFTFITFITVGLVVVLCSGSFLLLIMKRKILKSALHQQSDHQITENNQLYEELPESHPSSNDVPTMLSNQTSASDLNNIPTNFCVYSTVTNQQSDLSHTQLANQVTYTECDYYANLESPEATLNKTTECLYAKVKHRQ
ncbi:uncharacterized protein LOC130435807 [Triplophysa dalaica]|uniref:uncharacterized protein LOC130435807 n=1 Tax=Triplophysa dalaica TaxID=1582913 RepID=UPI0024DF6633|nr:uncharacterized protein LOC130435807 [Triplophysa dalaica]